MLIEKIYNANYEANVLHEFPNDETQRFYFPNNKNGKDGIILSIIPENRENWIGIFEFGKLINNGMNGVFSHPNSDYICIVSNGAGYIVNSNNPEEWEEIKLTPITDVKIISEKNIVIFSGQTEICAYDKNGLKWISSRISWDGHSITEIDSNVIKGKYYDIRSDDDSEFEVDVETGKVNGGAEA